jgi:hypothetical protein
VSSSAGDESWQLLTAAELGAGLVAEVASLGARLIGDAHPTVETLRDRLAADRDCLLVVQPAGAPTRIAAYSTVYCLSAAATARVLDGTLTRGAAITTTDLSPDRGAGLYVGMVATDPMLGTRLLALRLLATLLLSRLASQQDIAWVFARPATGAGRRVLRNLGFAEISDATPIWARTVEGRYARPGGLVSRHELAELASSTRRPGWT